MDAHNDIRIIESVSDIKVSWQKKSVLFKDSNLAVLRCGDYEVFVDAMKHTAWHQHAGSSLLGQVEPIDSSNIHSGYKWETEDCNVYLIAFAQNEEYAVQISYLIKDKK